MKKELFKCSNCSQKIEASKIVVFDGKVECYSCWEKGIDKFKVKELRDKLIPYLEIDRSELKKIDLEIKKLEPIPEPEPQLKKYTQKCPNCEKTFSCEVEESDTSEKEANANLSEQISKHVKEVHEKNEEEEEKKLSELSEDDNNEASKKKRINSDTSRSQNGSQSSTNENKILLPLMIISVLLVSVVGIFFLTKKVK